MFAKTKRRSDSLDRYGRTADLLDRWFNGGGENIERLGYKSRTNFAANIPATSRISYSEFDDTAFLEVNRVMSKIRLRDDGEYKILKRYFTKDSDGRNLGERVVAERERTTRYRVQIVITQNVQAIDYQIDWKLI